jgi:hypothetical protein
VVAFRREEPDEMPSAKCFGFIQTYDEKPRRRLWELLKSQGMQENQQVVFLSDGGDTMRQLQEYLHPCSEHLIDWFHITMRLTVLQQQAKGLQTERPQFCQEISKQLESVKHLLWHGDTEEALERIGGLNIELDLLRAHPQRTNSARTSGSSRPTSETTSNSFRTSENATAGRNNQYRFCRIDDQSGCQQAVRQKAADAVDAARRTLAVTNTNQSP